MRRETGTGILEDHFSEANRHGGRCLMTPATVHYGRAQQLFQDRQSVLQQAYAAHPERFVKGLPVPPSLPTEVWINPPKSGAAYGAVAPTGVDMDDLH